MHGYKAGKVPVPEWSKPPITADNALGSRAVLGRAVLASACMILLTSAQNPSSGSAGSGFSEAAVEQPRDPSRSQPRLAMKGDGADADQPLMEIVAANPFSANYRDGVSPGRALECLTQAIYYEGAQEPDSGQQAIAQVVLNRVAHPAFPNTVCGVVYEGSYRSTGCQFTFTCDGSLARRPSTGSWERARRVAQIALGGGVYRGVGTATHYHADYVRPYWSPSLDRIDQIGAHIFYTWQGASGRREAFTMAYGGMEPSIANATIAKTDAVSPDPMTAAQPEDLIPAEQVAPAMRNSFRARPLLMAGGTEDLRQ